MRGLTSKFSVGCGRAGTDRQFFYVNGRPCNMNKVPKLDSFSIIFWSLLSGSKMFQRSLPLVQCHTSTIHCCQFYITNTYEIFCKISIDLTVISEVYDVNVSPDKRTILLHSEGNLISSLKVNLFFSHCISSAQMFPPGYSRGSFCTFPGNFWSRGDAVALENINAEFTFRGIVQSDCP